MSMSSVSQDFNPYDYFQPVSAAEDGPSFVDLLASQEQRESEFQINSDSFGAISDSYSDNVFTESSPSPLMSSGDVVRTGNTEEANKSDETKSGEIKKDEETKKAPKTIGQRLMMAFAGLASLALGGAIAFGALHIWPLLAAVGIVIAAASLALLLTTSGSGGEAAATGIGVGLAIAGGPITAAIGGIIGAFAAFKEALT